MLGYSIEILYQFHDGPHIYIRRNQIRYFTFLQMWLPKNDLQLGDSRLTNSEQLTGL